jgi:anti-sigma B factor antagonist
MRPDNDDDFLAGDVPAPGDSGILKKGRAAAPSGVLQVYEAGKVTVVGFNGVEVPDEICVAGYRDQLEKLIDDHRCETLAFDLTGVKLVPSGMLGLLVSLKKKGVQIDLFNASDSLREALEVTHLLPLFNLRELRD